MINQLSEDISSRTKSISGFTTSKHLTNFIGSENPELASSTSISNINKQSSASSSVYSLASTHKSRQSIPQAYEQSFNIQSTSNIFSQLGEYFIFISLLLLFLSATEIIE